MHKFRSLLEDEVSPLVLYKVSFFQHLQFFDHINLFITFKIVKTCVLAHHAFPK